MGGEEKKIKGRSRDRGSEIVRQRLMGRKIDKRKGKG